MTPISLSVRSWRVAVAGDPDRYAVPASRSLRQTVSARPVRPRASEPIVVELLQEISGTMPSGLLAARFTPAGTSLLEVDVAEGSEFDLSGPSVTSPLDNPMTVGLPPDLAAATTAGLAALWSDRPPPAGTLRVVGGAYDSASSVRSFMLCGRLLGEVVMAYADGTSVAQALEAALEPLRSI